MSSGVSFLTMAAWRIPSEDWKFGLWSNSYAENVSMDGDTIILWTGAYELKLSRRGLQGCC